MTPSSQGQSSQASTAITCQVHFFLHTTRLLPYFHSKNLTTQTSWVKILQRVPMESISNAILSESPPVVLNKLRPILGGGGGESPTYSMTVLQCQGLEWNEYQDIILLAALSHGPLRVGENADDVTI